MEELDQMNVKANEQDTQGTDYDIRDRKLTTATSQQVVNSGDVVLLKDTSGNFHEIAKDSFMSAVRGALGSLIKSYDKGTNINGVAVTGSTGTVNDLGFSSPSDLASVLGVPQRIWTWSFSNKSHVYINSGAPLFAALVFIQRSNAAAEAAGLVMGYGSHNDSRTISEDILGTTGITIGNSKVTIPGSEKVTIVQLAGTSAIDLSSD